MQHCMLPHQLEAGGRAEGDGLHAGAGGTGEAASHTAVPGLGTSYLPLRANIVRCLLPLPIQLCRTGPAPPAAHPPEKARACRTAPAGFCLPPGSTPGRRARSAPQSGCGKWGSAGDSRAAVSGGIPVDYQTAQWSWHSGQMYGAMHWCTVCAHYSSTLLQRVVRPHREPPNRKKGMK